MAEHPTGGLDALTVLTVVGQAVDTMELGTAAIPTYPRHPMVLAGQALTAQSAMGGRLTLGDRIKPAERPPQILVAPLGPQALRVAGGRTAGTSLAWVGPKTIRDHIVPTIGEAAADAGRQEPRILATLPICVTDERARIRSRIIAVAAMYAQLPSCQAAQNP